MVISWNESRRNANTNQRPGCTGTIAPRTSHTIGQFTGAFNAYVVNVMWHSGLVGCTDWSVRISARREMASGAMATHLNQMIGPRGHPRPYCLFVERISLWASCESRALSWWFATTASKKI